MRTLRKRAKRAPKAKTPSQQFVDAAHRFEADRDEAAFQRRLAEIAKAKPADKKAKD